MKLRLTTRSTQNTLDLAILSLAYWAAFYLRFDGHLPPQMWKRLLFTWPYIAGFELAVLHLFSIQRFSWRHVGLRDATRIYWSTLAIGVSLLVVRLIAGVALPHYSEAQYALIPTGVILGNHILSFLGVVGIRVIRRVIAERESKLRLYHRTTEMVPTLLIGAGQAGDQVLREVEKRPDLGMEVVGFLDDDASKLGLTIRGVRVWGSVDDLSRVSARLGVRQVVVTIADVDPNVIRRILGNCEQAQVRAKIVPGLYQLFEDSPGLSRLRDVSIEDVLGREAVNLDMGLVANFLTGKRVLVTGAGGSIGSELCRQVARFAPKSLVLLERSEFALFTIQQELQRTYRDVTFQPRICDICDEQRLEAVFGLDKPEVVFHAAAHKHVPMMEGNPGEAIKNNVFGTKAVADAALRHQSAAFVLISTDKAVNPTSIMGATKRVAEMYVQALSVACETKFVAVRFGNVLGSTGSVIPTFKAQIAAGGPITVTHPEMKRYFMTIPEASQLVMQAAAFGTGGEIFVLDMGAPVKIVDLANDLIRLSGLVPGVDIKIEFTGVRPGEKLFEELGFDAERMTTTTHPKIFRGQLMATPISEVECALEHLHRFVGSNIADEVRNALRYVVTEMIVDGSHVSAQSELVSIHPNHDSASAPPAKIALATSLQH